MAAVEEGEGVDKRRLFKKPHKKRIKTNSMTVDGLRKTIGNLEGQLKQLGIAVTYPAPQHEGTPMIGHTRGNTKSNRKVVKLHQEAELAQIVLHLEALIPPTCDHESGSEDGGVQPSDTGDGNAEADHFLDAYDQEPAFLP